MKKILPIILFLLVNGGIWGSMVLEESTTDMETYHMEMELRKPDESIYVKSIPVMPMAKRVGETVMAPPPVYSTQEEWEAIREELEENKSPLPPIQSYYEPSRSAKVVKEEASSIWRIIVSGISFLLVLANQLLTLAGKAAEVVIRWKEALKKT